MPGFTQIIILTFSAVLGIVGFVGELLYQIQHPEMMKFLVWIAERGYFPPKMTSALPFDLMVFGFLGLFGGWLLHTVVCKNEFNDQYNSEEEIMKWMVFLFPTIILFGLYFIFESLLLFIVLGMIFGLVILLYYTALAKCLW